MNKLISTGEILFAAFCLIAIICTQDLFGAAAATWTWTSPGYSVSGVSLDQQNNVLCTSQNGSAPVLYLSSLSPATGDTNYTYTFDYYDMSASSIPPVIGSDNTVYMGINTFYLRALESQPDSFALKWELYLGNRIGGIAFGTDSTIYVGTHKPSLNAVNPDGSVKWNSDISSSAGLVAKPAVGPNGIVYAGFGREWDYDNMNRIYAFEPDSGAIQWSFQTGYPVTNISIGIGGVIYSTGANGSLFSINPDGVCNWVDTLDLVEPQGWNIPLSQTAIGEDGTIYVFCKNQGRLKAIDPADGSINWQTNFPAAAVTIYSHPVIDSNGIIYFAAAINTSSYILYAVNPDGSLLWEYTVLENLYSTQPLNIGPDGTVYVSCYRKVIACQDPSHLSSGLAESPWPYWGCTAQNTRNSVLGATGAVSLAADTVTVMPGDTALIGINLNNTGAVVSGGQFIISASPANKVSFLDITTTARTAGWSIADSTSGSGRLVLFFSGSGGVLSAGSGDILTVSYALTASATPHDTISLSLSGVKLAGDNFEPLTCTLGSGWINVAGCDLTGDVTSDGSVNIYDLLLIVQYALTLRTPSSYQFDCADINNDQTINNVDVVLCVDLILSAGAGTLLAGVQEQEIRLNSDESATLLNGLKALKVEPEKIDKISLMLASTATRAQLPKAFALEQNSPNPFNPSTTISFSAPEGSSVQAKLQVFDLRGRLVATLAEGVHEPGVHSVFWDGTDNSGGKVSSGVYFYRLQAGDFTKTRKMVLLK